MLSGVSSINGQFREWTTEQVWDHKGIIYLSTQLLAYHLYSSYIAVIYSHARYFSFKTL